METKPIKQDTQEITVEDLTIDETQQEQVKGGREPGAIAYPNLKFTLSEEYS